MKNLQGAAAWGWGLVVGLILTGCLSAPQPASTERSPASPSAGRYEFTQPHMGLPFRIVLYAPDGATATNAAAAAFARIQQLNEILSDYDPESELSRLSRSAGSGRAIQVSADLWRLLVRSQQLAELSNGAFDITVGPAVILWRKARREKKLPSPERLAAARAAVGWRNLRLDPKRHTATLLVPDMRLDLGAIAKGYATDEAVAVLRARGVTRALVSGGGDMTAGNPPPGREGWRIEVAPLDTSNAPPARFVSLVRAGLATSGDLFQHLEIDGQRYSHILDPHTGIGLTDHSLVTVVARDCLTADSLATTVSVLGPDAGLKLIEATPGAAAYIVRKLDGRIEVRESSRFRRFRER